MLVSMSNIHLYYIQLWMNQMSNMTGDAWKDVRSAFSPIFTSGKLKGMMRHIDNVADNMLKCLQTKMDKVKKNRFEGLHRNV